MKIFLDDIRPAPGGWILTRTVDETIRYLSSSKVTHLSLDHDIGSFVETGNDVLIWLEEQAYLGNFGVIPRVIQIHTANPAAVKRMEQAVESIRRLKSE